MNVGFLTACMRERSLEDIIQWSGANGIAQIEVTTAHLGENTPERDETVRAALATSGVTLSSIAHYDGRLLEKQTDAAIAALNESVDRCVALGTDVLCTLTGLPPDGMTREDAIDGPFSEIFAPVLAYAASKGVKVALENWFATCIQNFDQWDRVLERLPKDNLGFNYDPSHLLWMGIDYLAGVEAYAERVFHAHAKDTEIRNEILKRSGNQARGWWRYCIPGQGRVQWGEFIARLRRIGYDGILSIEHEDRYIAPEEGVLQGKHYLEQFIA